MRFLLSIYLFVGRLRNRLRMDGVDLGDNQENTETTSPWIKSLRYLKVKKLSQIEFILFGKPFFNVLILLLSNLPSLLL